MARHGVAQFGSTLLDKFKWTLSHLLFPVLLLLVIVGISLGYIGLVDWGWGGWHSAGAVAGGLIVLGFYRSERKAWAHRTSMSVGIFQLGLICLYPPPLLGVVAHFMHSYGFETVAQVALEFRYRSLEGAAFLLLTHYLIWGLKVRKEEWRGPSFPVDIPAVTPAQLRAAGPPKLRAAGTPAK